MEGGSWPHSEPRRCPAAHGLHALLRPHTQVYARRDAAEELLRRAAAIQRPTTACRLAGLRESPEMWPATPPATLYTVTHHQPMTTRALHGHPSPNRHLTPESWAVAGRPTGHNPALWR